MRITRSRLKYLPLVKWFFSPERTGCRLYSHILPLGFNCELAYRFYREFRFLDSSLFAWSLSESLPELVAALGIFDELFSGEVIYEEEYRLFRCMNTRIMLHGRETMTKWMSRCEDILESQKRELSGRVNHLKNKFLSQLQDPERTLCIYKVNTEECRKPGIVEGIGQLRNALAALGAVNTDLLIVCEEVVRDRLENLDGCFVRTIREFNPVDNVADSGIGDGAGWHRLYSEFRPVRLARKKHAFKFEKK